MARKKVLFSTFSNFISNGPHYTKLFAFMNVSVMQNDKCDGAVMLFNRAFLSQKPRKENRCPGTKYSRRERERERERERGKSKARGASQSDSQSHMYSALNSVIFV
jgi:hypothetical protein